MPDIEDIILKAREEGASDLHLSAGSPPGIRVNGKMSIMNLPKLLPSDTLEMLLAMLTKQQIDIFEEYGEYEGAVSLPAAGRCRVNVYRQKGQASLALRLIDKHIPTAEELGIPVAVMKLCELKQGLVLVGGNPGSGRTTTLAAMIAHINNQKEVHIVTLEKPMEYLHDQKKAIISQREIGTDAADFLKAMRHAMRADADVIVIDQITELDILEAAIMAAQAGHLVIAAMSGHNTQEMLDVMTSHLPEQKRSQFLNSLHAVLQAVMVQRINFSVMKQGSKAIFEIVQ